MASFDGLGYGFTGPQGTATFRNPSDNSLAVGPDHIVQTVNSKMAVFTKKGARFNTTGSVLYGPVDTGNVFRGFGDFGDLNNGDAVVRYDQLADRWLIVMPIFRRLPFPKNEPPGKSGGPVQISLPGVEGQPGAAKVLHQPSLDEVAAGNRGWRGRQAKEGSYAMCYAVSTSPDPLGTYYRYLFERPLFPDYPRPAIWPDGYYVTTSAGDTVVQKRVCVADRTKMLAGQAATEQCVGKSGVNFLNPADLDGTMLPPSGAPNILLAAGGTQLQSVYSDDGIYVYKMHVDWTTPSATTLTGPTKITVASYNYLCNGQLTSCVPQQGTTTKLDAQGDKLMQRLAYRNFGDHQSLVITHSINGPSTGGGVRWYEFRVDAAGNVTLYQQSTFVPDASYRWLASAAMDSRGDIGIGYSFGDASSYPGQRFAARSAADPLGTLGFHESVVAAGQAAQISGLRWEDFSTTVIDPSDDATFWYMGDYYKSGAKSRSIHIGSFRVP